MDAVRVNGAQSTDPPLIGYSHSSFANASGSSVLGQLGTSDYADAINTGRTWTIDGLPLTLADVFKESAHPHPISPDHHHHLPQPPPSTTSIDRLRLASMMMFFRIPAVLVLLFLTLGASAAPGVKPLQIVVQQQSKRDLWVPPILSPHRGTVWHIGKTATVTWYV